MKIVGQYKAYKLQEIENKRVINDQVNGKPIVLFSLYPFMIRSYDPIIDDKTALQFEYNAKNNTFLDKETRSEWNFEGKA
ncbi:MAG: DUF3179 domain-containing protein, partial [Nitrososphaeraceae archaeon]